MESELGKYNLSELSNIELPCKIKVSCTLGDVVVTVDHDWLTVDLIDKDGEILENSGVHLKSCFNGEGW